MLIVYARLLKMNGDRWGIMCGNMYEVIVYHCPDGTDFGMPQVY
jgi:hypothetical protein